MANLYSWFNERYESKFSDKTFISRRALNINFFIISMR